VFTFLTVRFYARGPSDPSREHLTPSEIDRLIAAARQLGRHGHRDATMILLAYRHGLRVSELVSLRREQLGVS
jgi:integrase